MRQIKVVLFDLGNVLVDLGDKSEIARFLNTDDALEVIWRKWLESEAVAKFDSGKIGLNDFVEQLMGEVGYTGDNNAFKEAFVAWPKGLFDGALELVNSIPDHLHKAVLSNTNAAHWGRLMDEMGLSGQFNSYFASHQMGKVKPDPASFQYVLSALNVMPDEILFMDDNKLNVDAANEIGIKSFLVRGVEEARDCLKQNGILS
ncbi:HAD family hydrolase [Marinomonas balearica]|uniref:Putative hydrolase of the HAD superfamily n=1 Tax=Marinomonas balearica TaxID=491947 RepID=A0A4R6MC44_9GAMM|nr:HAD family phosphatase [Marinomonas balearica]TDO98705.1 putative hydrolase of the HAD superfamily [Marinomonas balearica]